MAIIPQKGESASPDAPVKQVHQITDRVAGVVIGGTWESHFGAVRGGGLQQGPSNGPNRLITIAELRPQFVGSFDVDPLQVPEAHQNMRLELILVGCKIMRHAALPRKLRGFDTDTESMYI